MRAGAPTQTAFPPVRAISKYVVGSIVADPALLRLAPQGKPMVFSASAVAGRALPLGR